MLVQTIVKVIVNRLNDTALSSPENTHTVDIREEDRGHEDEEAIQVPKVSLMIKKKKRVRGCPVACFQSVFVFVFQK